VSETPGDLDVEVATWLVGEEGRDAVTRTAEALSGGDDTLQVVSRLRRAGLDQGRAAAVVGAAEARRRARRRWPDADDLLFTRAGLEQASDPDVSAWRAGRFTDVRAVEDRAAGCGGDTLALAATGSEVTALDLDAGRLVLLRHNAATRGFDVRAVVADALVEPPPSRGPVHCDPARRTGERRIRRLADHQPSVPALVRHLAGVAAGPGLAVVLGPAVDPEDPDLPEDTEVEFVQLGRHLVEAVAWTGALRRPGARRTATVLPAPSPGGATGTPVTRSRDTRPPRLPTGPVGELLVEVAPAAVRARLHDELGAEIGARRLAARRALLTVDRDPGASPWWQVRAVEAVLPAGARPIRRWLRGRDERPVEVVLHGVDLDPAVFRRELGDPPSGPDGRRIEVVRGDEGAFAVVTTTRGGR
jgi:hypothetical protein